MIDLISAILFGLSSNIDNIAIGISYGIKKVHITILQNILIALFTSIITIIAMKFGNFITLFLPINLSNILGSLILIGIGIFEIIKYSIKKIVSFKNNINRLKKNQSFKEQKEKQLDLTTYNRVSSTILPLKSLISIIFTLSWNNIATGIAASITGINTLYTFICTLLFSFCFMHIGNKVGKNILNAFILKYSDIIAALLLLILGIIQII